MKESWKPVVGHPGYEVSSLGRVKSRIGREVRILKPGIASRDYPRVVLSGRIGRTVHSLVAEAFLGPRPNGKQIRHLDGNKVKSILANLVYGTPAENAADSIRHGSSPVGSKHYVAKLTERIVRAIRKSEGKVTKAELARRYGVSRAAIRLAQAGKTWKYV